MCSLWRLGSFTLGIQRQGSNLNLTLGTTDRRPTPVVDHDGWCGFGDLGLEVKKHGGSFESVGQWEVGHDTPNSKTH